jgi:F0F1-type ATP synthase assembly protein I
MDGLRFTLRLLGLGWYVAFCIILGVLVGIWIDGIFGTEVIFTIVGTVLGCSLAFFGVYRMIIPVMKDKESRGPNGLED